MKAIKTNIIINSIRSRRDGSLGFSAETPELTSEEKVAFMNLQGQALDTLFEPTEYVSDEVINVEKEIGNKSQSERIRNSLYILLSKELGRSPTKDEWSVFYLKKTEGIITSIKGKIEQYD